MKLTQLRTLLLLTVATLFGLQAQAQSKADKITKMMNQHAKDGLFHGAVLVAKGNKVIFSKGYGYANYDKKTNITTASAFNLASVSKQFTAMGIMLLKEQGKLKYEDKITQYLPIKADPNITIRHLLNHTSGIWDYGRLFRKNWDRAKLVTNNDVIERINALEKRNYFTPGEKFKYSNTGYILLASIIEKASGLSFPKFMHKHIFKPLGMKNSYAFNLTMKGQQPGRVLGYRLADKKAQLNDLFYLDGVFGDGNVYSSVDDLFTWDRALYTEKLVKKATLEQAFTPATLNNGKKSYYGFGWGLHKGNERVRHGGSWVGFRTYIIRNFADKTTTILLDNSTNRAATRIAKNLDKLMANKPFKPIVKRKFVAVEASVLKQYVGSYKTKRRAFSIVQKGAKLFVKLSKTSPPMPLQAVSKSRFFFKRMQVDLEFVTEGNQKAHKMFIHVGSRKIPGERVTGESNK